MYNLTQLMTFIKVAELGSFNKVAEKEFLSPNAVMKQINNLEAELGGIRLFERSRKGNALTPAGEMLLREAKNIIDLCEESRERVVRAFHHAENTIRIAVTYDMNLYFLNPLFREVHKRRPDLRVEIKPVIYDTKLDKVLWNDFNAITDVLFGSIDDINEEYLKINNTIYEGIRLFTSPLYCTVSANHRLAEKESVRMADLKGEVVGVLNENWGIASGRLIKRIRDEHPEINLVELPYTNEEVSNGIANDGFVMIDYLGTANSHPYLVSIPFVKEETEDYTCPFGLLYTEPISPAVAAMAETIREILEEQPDILGAYEPIKF